MFGIPMFGWWRSVVPVVTPARPNDLRRQHRLRSFACLGLVVASVFVTSGLVVAAEEDEEDALITVKHITGEVSIIRPHYLSVVYKQDAETRMEYEMVFPMNKDVEFFHKKSLDDIEVGDTVRVTYEEKTWTTEDGMERMKRKAKEVWFVRPAKKGLRSRKYQRMLAGWPIAEPWFSQAGTHLTFCGSDGSIS